MRVYLAVTFWGEEYRRYFLDFCLASLLAPGNIPAITDKSSSRLLVATNDSDWAALQNEPTFLAVKELIAIEQVPFDNASYSAAHGKMLVMSQAHKRLAEIMFKDRAHGIFIYPDMIAAEGFIARLEQLRMQGFAVVMFMNVRFANGGLIDELREKDLIQRGKPLVLSPKQLVKLTIRHAHSEMRRSRFEADCEDHGCSSYFWVVAAGEDLLFHCGSWIPSLIDYGAIVQHDDTTFTSWTLDGDYITKNFRDPKTYYFVHDTSELFMISFTPETSVHYSLAPVPKYRIPLLRTSLKVIGAHRFLYRQVPMDSLIKEQFRLPVRFCGGNCSETEWRAVEHGAARIIARMERGGNAVERIVYILLLILRLCVRVVRALWISRRAIARRINQIMRGDRVARKRVTWRLRQLLYHLRGQQFSDPEPRT